VLSSQMSASSKCAFACAALWKSNRPSVLVEMRRPRTARERQARNSASHSCGSSSVCDDRPSDAMSIAYDRPSTSFEVVGERLAEQQRECPGAMRFRASRHQCAESESTAGNGRTSLRSAWSAGHRRLPPTPATQCRQVDSAQRARQVLPSRIAWERVATPAAVPGRSPRFARSSKASVPRSVSLTERQHRRVRDVHCRGVPRRPLICRWSPGCLPGQHDRRVARVGAQPAFALGSPEAQ
jgi:hypothetical protein